MIAAAGLTRRSLVSGALRVEALWFAHAAPDVDVWCLAVDTIQPSVLVEGLELLSEMERLRYSRLRFRRDRDAYLAKRLLVRRALSAYADVAPEDWRFTVDAHGRPRIAEDCGAAGLRFSLARSGGLVVCGVSREAMVGVDVEDLARPQSGELPVYVLSGEERERLAGLAQGERWAAFLHLWTLKEAYVKARGMGLSLPVAEASFDLERAGEIGVRFWAELADDTGRWRFGQVTVLERYVMATAVREG